MTRLRIAAWVAALLIALPAASWAWPQEFIASDVCSVPPEEIATAWGLAPRHAASHWADNGVLGVQLIACSVPAGIAWPGDTPTYTFQFTNRTAQALDIAARVRVIRYELYTKGEDVFALGMRRIADCGTVPIRITVAANGWCDVPVAPGLPERKGGYALIIEPDGQDALFAAGTIRTFRPESLEPRRFYRLTMDLGEPGVLGRLAVTQNRVGFPFKPPSDPDFEAWYHEQTADLRKLQAAHLPVCVEFGAGDPRHRCLPLGRARPWLDDQGVMRDSKSDYAWVPGFDREFTALARRLASDFGWPKGPVNAMKLWNEPWNGISISGWGADDERYREIYGALCDGVEAARREAGVQVLLGGCDSSSNTYDKLFADGSTHWLPRLDFLSIHYQGTDPHSTVKLWRERKDADGRPAPVLIWDTESWVANSDDRVAGVLASMFAFGHDRVVGIQGDSVVAAIRNLQVRTTTGTEPRRINHTWSVGAAVGAFQHFVGERPFRDLLLRPGLPHAMRFAGAGAEDVTVVIVGDLGSIYGQDGAVFRTCRPLAELREREELRARLAALPAGDPARPALQTRIDTAQPWRECRLSLAADAHYGLYDFYGNPVPSSGGRITVPLDARGFYLRGDGTPGSAAALVAAVRAGRIDGLAPVAIQLVDARQPIASRPAFALTMTNVLNRRVTAAITAGIAGLTVAQPGPVAIQPGETVTLPLAVSGGSARADNRYPCRVVADFGADGVVTHEEELRVDLISRRTITVDGRLEDWQDAIPQPIQFTGAQTQTLTEKAWLPFITADASVKQGLAVGWLAYDEAGIYFAARINDTTPSDGLPRFSDHAYWDEAFYPAVCRAAASGDELAWPAGVRRFSYRANPVLPCGNFPNADNVQLAFNVLPAEAKAEFPCPPGTFPGFTTGPTTDYEYALNTVAARYGGGTEVWRLATPAMPPKHFYPRQPASPADGPVPGARLVTSHVGATRIVECAIPWAELPEVHAAMLAGTPVKFSFRVNDDAGVGCLELARGRSVSRRGRGFHADWLEHWEPQLAFGWER